MQRCSMAFQSRSPRFTPGRTYSGSDPRALLADDPFRGTHPYQYQSENIYKRHFKGGRDIYDQPSTMTSVGFRFGVVVQEPSRPTTPFTSTLPRLTTVRPMEPLRRSTYGPEVCALRAANETIACPPCLRPVTDARSSLACFLQLNCRTLTYLPLTLSPR